MQKEEHTYLGILFRSRNITTKEDINQKAMLARRTLYSLTGTGTHAQGILPGISVQLWNTYCLSQLMCGMEAINITKSNRGELDKHQLLIMKQSIGLPTQAANAAATILTGAIPISTRIQEQKILALCKICSQESNTIGKKLLYYMLGTTTCKKWCLSEVQEMLGKLGLPSLEYILTHHAKPSVWKRVVRAAILQMPIRKKKKKKENAILEETANNKSTLYIQIVYGLP